MIVPHMPSRPEELVPFADVVRSTAAHRLWQGQSVDLDTLQAFAYLAGGGYRVPVGTAVALTVLRHPYDLAVQARTSATLTGHDVVLGVGTGDDDVARALRGVPYPSPLTAAREYLTVLRGLLRGDAVDVAGSEISMHGALLPRAHPPVSLGLGVLRPGTARLAGEVADVAVTWMTPPHYVRDVLVPAIRAGAEAAGRPMPQIVTVVHAAVARAGRDPYRTAYCAAHRHLALRHYADMLRRSGLAVHESLPALGARALVDSGTFVHGGRAEIVDALAAFGGAGVDEVVLNVAGVHAAEGPDAALDDLHDIVDAVLGSAAVAAR